MEFLFVILFLVSFVINSHFICILSNFASYVAYFSCLFLYFCRNFTFLYYFFLFFCPLLCSFFLSLLIYFLIYYLIFSLVILLFHTFLQNFAYVYGSLLLWIIHFVYWNCQLPHPLRIRTAHFIQVRMRCMEWLCHKFNFRFYIDAYTRPI